ncbi:MAG TPA: DUF3618 domain-containing protein [Arachnia sp.]|nr:DUF3618 domain-containing protein [Arachnia sp.]
MSNNPEEIRRDIERTRAELSENVNALGDSAKPSNVVREQVDNVKDSVLGIKERIFGSDTNPYDDGAVGAVADAAGEAVGDARDAVVGAPRQVKTATRGNPIAAGLIAAGLGALIGGLIPASKMEKEGATQLKDAAEPALEQLEEMAIEAKDHLQPRAQEAVENVKGVAQEAGDNIMADAQVAKDEVTQQSPVVRGDRQDRRPGQGRRHPRRSRPGPQPLTEAQGPDPELIRVGPFALSIEKPRVTDQMSPTSAAVPIPALVSLWRGRVGRVPTGRLWSQSVHAGGQSGDPRVGHPDAQPPCRPPPSRDLKVPPGAAIRLLGRPARGRIWCRLRHQIHRTSSRVS